MSHGITRSDKMIYLAGTETPWHDKGTPISEDYAYDAKGASVVVFPWQVGMCDLQAVMPDGTIKSLRRHRCTYRMDNGELFAPVGKDHTNLQNDDLAAWFQPLLDRRVAKLETGGSLHGGRRVWMLARWLSGSDIDVGDGDRIERFVLLTNSHDGTMAIRCGVTLVRVVCANTLGFALTGDFAKKADKRGLVRLRHTKGILDSLDKVREAIEATDAAFEGVAAKYRQLTQKQVGGKAWIQAFVDAVYGKNVEAIEKGRQSNPKRVEKMTELFEGGVGQDLTSSKGTVWGLYNALTEYETHHKGKDGDGRLEGLCPGGDRDAILARALDVATIMATTKLSLDNVFDADALERIMLGKISAEGAAIPARMIA